MDIEIIMPVKPPHKCGEVVKLRVCAYARVSTDSEEQKTSYDVQIEEYTTRIKSNPEWEFVKVYADHGLTGTSLKRPDFQEMMEAARRGEIDIILVKSISRLSRNVLDCIKVIRELQSLGVEVIFEKENISTNNKHMEQFLLMMASFAQSESESISQNVKWGIYQRTKNGTPHINCARFLGYDKVIDPETSKPKLVINEEQAKTVRMMFEMYLEGLGYLEIARELKKRERKTVSGSTNWHTSTVKQVLENEKHSGVLLLQKYITLDPLTHKSVRNDNIAPMFRIEDTHEAIISMEMWNRVQAERERRFKISSGQDCDRTKYHTRYAFSGKLFCACCGQNLKRHHWRASKNLPQRQTWQCSHSLNKEKLCKARAIAETTIQKSFVDVFNSIIVDKKGFYDSFFRAVERAIEKGANKTDYAKLQKQFNKEQDKLKSVTMMRVNQEISQTEFLALRSEIDVKIKELGEKLSTMIDTQASTTDRREKIAKIKEVLHSHDKPIEQYDDDLFRVMVDKVIVSSPVDLKFVLVNGVEIEYDATKHHTGRPVKKAVA